MPIGGGGGGGGAPSGAAGGDLGGTYPNPTVDLLTGGGTIAAQLLIAPTSAANPLTLQSDPAEGHVDLLDCALVEESSWEARIRANDHGSNNVDAALSLFANGTGITTIEAYDDSGTGKFVYASNAGLTVNAKTGVVGSILLVQVGATQLLAVDETGAVVATGTLTPAAAAAATHAPRLSQLSPVGTITSGALPTVQLVTATGAQILTTRDAETVTPCTFNPGAATTATVTVALSPDNVTYSTLGVVTEPVGVAFDGTIHLVKVRVPAGWYLKLTVNAQATLGVTTYY